MALRLARSLLAQKKAQEAFDVLETQLAREMHPPVLLFYLKTLHEAGKTREARLYLQRLRNDRPAGFRPDTRAKLARWEADLSVLLDHPVGAVRAYRQALLGDRENFELWNDLALAMRLRKRPDRADRSFAWAHRLSPRHFAPLLNRLELALERGDTALAKELATTLENVSAPARVLERAREVATAVREPAAAGPNGTTVTRSATLLKLRRGASYVSFNTMLRGIHEVDERHAGDAQQP
jgi:tetratricopeptide (TPR) repeat protein